MGAIHNRTIGMLTLQRKSERTQISIGLVIIGLWIISLVGFIVMLILDVIKIIDIIKINQGNGL